MDVTIIGGGIGGLTAALALHARGINATVFEQAPEIRPLGVGINVLPHATARLAALGVLPALEAVAVETQEAAYFNRFGQLILAEPVGRRAGYATPQLSIHRGALQMALFAAARDRLGAGRIVTGMKCTSVTSDHTRATATFADSTTGAALAPVHADAIIASDGIHSIARTTFFPDEGPPVYSGCNMWRGTTRGAPFLTGATMVRAGWLTQGKMVIYPIQNFPDGTQLINWVAELETPNYLHNDWARPGKLEDFLPAFADWHFDWLDVPDLIQRADQVLEYPMTDKDPLPRWTHGRITLLGDAAHPMVPRGSNGAGQAILDAAALADCLADHPTDAPTALQAYETRRLEPTARVVRTNRTTPPDVIIKEVWERSGDRPFAHIDDIIPHAELTAMVDNYKRIAGYDHASLATAR